MGCRMNNATLAQLKDALGFVFECQLKKEDGETPVVMRTREGIDSVFYIDLEDGRIVLTPESFYRDPKAAGDESKKEG